MILLMLFGVSLLSITLMLLIVALALLIFDILDGVHDFLFKTGVITFALGCFSILTGTIIGLWSTF